MIKYALIFISSIGFAIANMFSIQGVEISHNIPEFLTPGKTYDIDIILQKSTISGFAKLQFELPDGINVVAVETQNSTFTFKKGVVKNIWMNIPEEKEIILSYKFEVSADFSQSSIVKGRLVYIYENEKLTTEMEPYAIKPGSEDVNGVKTAITSDFKSEDIKVDRKIKSIANNEFEITITLIKSGLEGFAKIEEDLPKGFEARPMKTSKSVFSVVDNKAKFIWFNVPPEETIEVSYFLSTTKSVDEKTVLSGSFSYLYNDEALEIDLPYEKLMYHINPNEYTAAQEMAAIQDVEDTEILDNEETESAESTQEENSETVDNPTVIVAGIETSDEDDMVPAEEAITTDAVVETIQNIDEVAIEEIDEGSDVVVIQEESEVETPSEEDNSVTANVENTNQVESEKDPMEIQSSIFYRVQLAAGHQNVDVKVFKKKHGFIGEIYLDSHEGWIKYTTGNFEDYVDARNRREIIKSDYDFNGPFVTAYNSGERITVQEALLISKQKWVK